jgi:hypothetical protein
MSRSTGGIAYSAVIERGGAGRISPSQAADYHLRSSAARMHQTPLDLSHAADHRASISAPRWTAGSSTKSCITKTGPGPLETAGGRVRFARPAARFRQHAPAGIVLEDWPKWQLCRFAEIALEIMCYGLCHAISPSQTPASLFQEGEAATLKCSRTCAKIHQRRSRTRSTSRRYRALPARRGDHPRSMATGGAAPAS